MTDEKPLHLTVTVTIAPHEHGRIFFNVEYNAHPDILFIGGWGHGHYEEGEEKLAKQRCVDMLKRDAPHRTIEKVTFKLTDDRQKQSTLLQFS